MARRAAIHMNHKLSIGSWAYTIGPYQDRPIDWETVCQRLAALGFHGVELGAFDPHPTPEAFPEVEQRAELRARLDEHGLGLSGIAANLWAEQLLTVEEPTSWIENFERNCAFSVDLGCKTLRIDTVQPPTMVAEVGEERAFQRVTKAFTRASEIAADHGLNVTWEFEPGFAFNKPSEVLRVLDAVQNSNFGVLYDTSHGHMCAVVGARQNGERETLAGGQLEFIDRLDGRINHIHLIDSDNTCHLDAEGNDETSMHLPFGEGVVDFDPILSRLEKVDPGHPWWTIDLCFWPDAWGATEHCKTWLDGEILRRGA